MDHFTNGGRRRSARDLLFDDKVMVSASGHRGEVGDRENLLLASDFSQALADLLGDLTTKTRVDLVKDRHHVMVNCLEGNREKYSAELPSTRQGRERTLGLAGVRREKDLRVRAVVAVHHETYGSVGEGDPRQLTTHGVREGRGREFSFARARAASATSRSSNPLISRSIAATRDASPSAS